MAGVCGFSQAMSGTVIATQTTGDCKTAICDGNGGTTTKNDDADVPAAMNDCYMAGCSAGTPTQTPLTINTPCTSGGGKFCDGAGKCVQCTQNSQCTSNVCKTNTCVVATCNDNVKNGSETDVDCGGAMCPKCAYMKACTTGSDCLGGSCVSSMCAATCTDTVKNGTESDVDCGGTSCAKCTSGKTCTADTDCQSNKCSGGKCADVLLLSEVQTRGDAGGNDDFVEIYNPTAYPVTFDLSWEVWTRSVATNACAALSKRFAGSGQIIPPHGHILFANSNGYNGSVTPDATYTSGFTDSGQIVLLKAGVLIDQVCYYFNATTQSNLTSCATPPAMWFVCEGAISNSPHNDTTGGSSNTDVSLERKPGGAAGNGQDTNDNSADWSSAVPSNPQNLASTPVP
jgi:hypothetical protein